MSTNTKIIYPRILLKISGEVLKGTNKFGIDINALTRIAKEIKFLVDIGIQVGVVVGSGNLFRGLGLSKLGISRVVSDHIGMLSTVINSLAMKDVMHSMSVNARVLSAVPLHGICNIYSSETANDFLYKKFVVIFAAGIGNPFFTTDSAACLRGIEIQSDILLKGTKVDGVYSEDPAKNSYATLYKKLKYHDVLKKELQVMDLTAFILARDHNLPINIFNINKPGALYRIIMGQDEGTFITS